MIGEAERIGWFRGALIITLLLDFDTRFFCGARTFCARLGLADIVGVGVGCGGS
jgi:hypothetical protein